MHGRSRRDYPHNKIHTAKQTQTKMHFSSSLHKAPAKPVLTAEEANTIQAETLRNDFGRSHLLPDSHITLAESGGYLVFWKGQPCNARTEGLPQAIARAKTHDIQTDLIWSHSGRWLDVTDI
jgi:hypothetical protein